MPERTCPHCGDDHEHWGRMIVDVASMERRYVDRIVKEAPDDEAVLIEGRAALTDHLREVTYNTAHLRRMTNRVENRPGESYPVLSLNVEWWDSVKTTDRKISGRHPNS